MANERTIRVVHVPPLDEGAARGPWWSIGEMSALDRFIAAEGDEGRLALGLDVLRQALDEAREQGLVGWEVEVFEYVCALESGEGLNRPL